MTTSAFTLPDLMDLLVTSVGLPGSARTDDPTRTTVDLGLDSLAFLQLQTELQERYGCPVDETTRAEDVTLGDLVEQVNASQGVNA